MECWLRSHFLQGASSLGPKASPKRQRGPTVAVLLVLVVCRGASAQGLIPSVNTAPMMSLPGLSAAKVAIADFNGDAKPDVAVAAVDLAVGTHFGALLGNGQGEFARLKTVRVKGMTGVFSPETYASPDSLAAADFNEDGKPDLVAARRALVDCTPCDTVLDVAVVFGDGTGGFHSLKVLNGGYYTHVADFNSDGHQDILTATGPSGGLLHLGDGKGQFTTNVVTPADSTTRSLNATVADVTGDNRPDFIKPQASNGVDVFPGNNQGGFGAALPSLVIGLSGGTPIAAGDFTGDGKADLALITGTPASTIAIYAGDGSGFFSTAPTTFAPLDRPSRLIPVQANGDAQMDLQSVGVNSTLATLLSQAGGTLVSPTRMVGLSNWSDMASGDVTGDGRPDIVTSVYSAAGSGTALQVSVAEPGASFRGPDTFNIPSPSGSGWVPVLPVAGDFTGDGKADLVIGDDIDVSNSNTGGVVAVLTGDGAGRFTRSGQYSLGLSPAWLAVGDFNGDGKPDIATDSSGQSLVVLTVNGAGAFTEAYKNTNFLASNRTVADMNGDGRTDIVSSTYGAGGLLTQIHQMGPSGAPGSPATYVVSATSATFFPAVKRVAAGDLNGDLRPDVVMLTDKFLAVLLNTGSGALGAAALLTIDAEARLLSLGDLNGDGRLDALVVNSGLVGQQLRPYLNDGTGRLVVSPHLQIARAAGEAAFPSGVGAIGPAIVDMNGDGKNDIVLQSFVSLRIGLGDGAGNFERSVFIPIRPDGAGTGTGGFHSGDLNGDGRPDLFGGSPWSKWILLNTTAVRLSISDPTIAEGGAGTVSMSFAVSLDAASNQPVTVDYATANGSATTGLDFTSASGTLTFSAGQTSRTVTVSIAGDATPEGDETFALVLSNPGNATIAKATGIGTILNHDGTSAVPGLSVADASITEGHSGNALISFPFTLTAASTSDVTVTYTISDGSATGETDYGGTTGTFTIPAGSTRKDLPIVVKGDQTIEPDETFILTLSNVSASATLIKPSALGTITNDDPPAASATVLQYRLYHDGTKEHLYTTDLNEYNILGTRGWTLEGVAYRMLTNGTYGGQLTVPLFRLYHPGILQHHWTTDSNESTTLGTIPQWNYEAIIGYVVPVQVSGTVALYRMALANPPLHLWTTDLNEYETLATRGWIKEGIVGYVVP
jgi:hypothetical protein